MKRDFMPIRVWTIGHSNRSVNDFLETLKEHKIQVLVDVRRFPTSKIENTSNHLRQNALHQINKKP
ncbi:MAG: DUF488 family protein [Candidatus Bathyarchaeia archaeon]